MNPTHTEQYPPISERAAGWLIAAVILVDCLIMAAVVLAVVRIFG
jgi:hypothetical protein